MRRAMMHAKATTGDVPFDYLPYLRNLRAAYSLFERFIILPAIRLLPSSYLYSPSDSA